jgi:hypothetical protein
MSILSSSGRFLFAVSFSLRQTMYKKAAIKKDGRSRKPSCNSWLEKPDSATVPRLIYLSAFFWITGGFIAQEAENKKEKRPARPLKTLRPYQSLSENTAFFSFIYNGFEIFCPYVIIRIFAAETTDLGQKKAREPYLRCVNIPKLFPAKVWLRKVAPRLFENYLLSPKKSTSHTTWIFAVLSQQKTGV